MAFHPFIEIQELAIGNTYTGVASNGTVAATVNDPGAPYWRGKIKVYTAGTAGGLFLPQAKCGSTLMNVWYSGAGTTKVTGHLVDSDATEYEFMDESSANFHFQPGDAFLVPPGWKLKFVSTTNVTAVGRLVVQWGSGWPNTLFQDVTYVGG